jgi:hypothetical protein
VPTKSQPTTTTGLDLLRVSLATLALILAGCGGQVSVIKNTPPAEKPVVKDATREELLEKFNRRLNP